MLAAPTEKHPGVETLHAFAAGEVLEGPVRTAIEAHVERCAACRAQLSRVDALRDVFASMSPEPLDDLRWARMARRVQAELRAPRVLRTAGRGDSPRDWLRWWAPAAVVAATAAAAVVVVMSWPKGATMPEATGPLTIALEPGADAHVDVPAAVLAADESTPRLLRVDGLPIDLTLASGLTLRLGPQAEVRLLESSLGRVALELERGAVEVWSPEGSDAPEVELRAPDLLATSRGASRFTVSLVGDQPAALEVERGEVRVARALPAPALVARSPEPGPSSDSRPTPRAPAPRGLRAGERSSSVPVVAAGPVAEELSDPWEATLRSYEAGELETAVDRARAVLAAAPDADRARQAWSLVCDAQLALDRPAEAAAACEALLGLTTGDEARVIHFRVATLYRARLQDCVRATAHYDRMVVVGSTALMDQDALLGRAECALASNDLAGAERDLGFLKGQRQARPAAYSALVERLRSARAARDKAIGKP